MAGLISVIIPTVPGREEHYERCLEAYVNRTEAPLEVLTEYDHPTCGLAWQAGAEKARGDYIHLTCDDLEPLEGWDTAAIRLCDTGVLPAPNVTNAETGAFECRPAWGASYPDGTDCGISIVPFFSRVQWQAIRPLFTAHYYTDDFVSFRGRQNGWLPLMCNRYAFKHHWAQSRRGAGMTQNERLLYDQGLYMQAIERVLHGEWTEPWPSP